METQAPNPSQTPTTPTKREGSVCSKASLRTAEPVVRHFELINLNTPTPHTVYTLSGPTAQKLLQAQRNKLRLEKSKSPFSLTPLKSKSKTPSRTKKTQKKFFGDVAIDSANLPSQPDFCQNLSHEIDRDLHFENKKILIEAKKLVKFAVKTNIRKGERRPVNSKCTQGKWFLYKGRSQMLSLVLAFAGTDEAAVGRLLRKVDSAVWEWGEEFENQRKFKKHMDKVLLNYGFANFENANLIIGPGKVIVEEVTLGKEGLLSENKVSGVKVISKICDLEAIAKKPQSLSKLDTCDSVRVYKASNLTPTSTHFPFEKQKMEDFFISEPQLRTPEKSDPPLPNLKILNPFNTRRLSNIPEISGIEHQNTQFEQDLEELDFFEFEVTKETKPEPKTPTPAHNQNDLCIDLSKKFNHCVFNHKKAHSAKKQIKNFDAERFITFSSSAKKNLVRSPIIKPNKNKNFRENHQPQTPNRVRIAPANLAATAEPGLAISAPAQNTANFQAVKNQGASFTERNRMYLARMVLLGVMVLMLLVLIRLFMEMGDGSESLGPVSHHHHSKHHKKMMLL